MICFNQYWLILVPLLSTKNLFLDIVEATKLVKKNLFSKNEKYEFFI